MRWRAGVELKAAIKRSVETDNTKPGGVIMEDAVKALAAALAVAIPALGTAWAQSRIGAAGVGALVEKPNMITVVLILIAIPETVVLLGFAVAMIIIFQ